MPYLPEEITDRKESYINGESVISEGEVVEPKTATQVKQTMDVIEAEFKELVSFDTLATDTTDIGATKMKIVGAMK